MSLVANQGLRRLSVAALARRVGLVPSGIYRHFRSKEEILTAVLDRIQERLLANVQAAREEHDDPLDCLRDVLMRHVRFIREGRAIPRLIFSDDVHAGRPDRRQRVLAVLRRYTDELDALVRVGQRQGRIRKELDVQTVVMAFLGMVVPAGILWHLTEGGFDVTRHAQRAWKMFCAAVAEPQESITP